MAQLARKFNQRAKADQKFYQVKILTKFIRRRPILNFIRRFFVVAPFGAVFSPRYPSQNDLNDQKRKRTAAPFQICDFIGIRYGIVIKPGYKSIIVF